MVAVWQSGRLPVQDGFLAYHRTGGRRPPVVLCHGLTDNGLCWRQLATDLAPRYDVVMLDARGHGESSRTDEGLAWNAATDILQCLDGLEIESAHLIGHSVGGRACAMLASQYPQRVSKLVLDEPAFVAQASDTGQHRYRMELGRQVRELQGMTRAQLHAVGRTRHAQWPAEEFEDWVTAKLQVDPLCLPHYPSNWQADVLNIATATLLLYGEPFHGSLLSDAMVEELKQLNPMIVATQVLNAGHNIRRENYSAYLAAVQEFLSP